MTDEIPRAAGSHRRVNRGRRLRVLLASLAVVVIAAGGVEASLHWRGESKRPAANAASSGYPRVSPSAKPSAASATALAVRRCVLIRALPSRPRLPLRRRPPRR